MDPPMLLCCFLIALLVSPILSDWPFPAHGVVDPSGYHQRYRADEYSSKEPFFQWWYYWVKDLEAGKHWAIAYAVSHSTDDNAGAYISVSEVDTATGKTWSKYEKFPLDSFQVSGEFNVELELNGESGFYKIVPDKSSDRVMIYGEMTHLDHVWMAEDIDRDTKIVWNITLDRIFGWYGQDAFESLDSYFGVIMWNTYGHCSEVEGYIQVADKIHTFENTPRYRGYMDMNWGTQFPVPPPGNDDKKYAWGWYFAGRSAEKKEDEIAIIFGVGEEYEGITFGSMVGRFGDIRIGNEHIALIEAGVWEESMFRFEFEGTNDGTIHYFNVTRSDWTNVEDIYGNATIPFRQVIMAKTDSIEVTLDMTSTWGQYLRLLFPTQNFIFSDFEGLGVTCAVTIKRSNGKVIKFTTNNAGIEYGYKVPIRLPN